MLYFFDGFCGLLAVYQGLILCKTVCICNHFCLVRLGTCFKRCQNIPCRILLTDGVDRFRES